MRKTIPPTPFSTALSGSTRETELRLKNIFSGPKKRPPALFLLLVLAACLLCGNLVSCQVAQEEKKLPPPDLSLIPVDWDSLPEPELTYTLAGGGNIEVSGAGDVYAVWDRSSVWDPASTENFFYFAGDPALFCPSLAGRGAEGTARWRNENQEIVEVDLVVNDDRLEDGTIDGFGLRFVVDCGSGTVVESSSESDMGDGNLELPEEDMIYAGRMLARMMREAEEYREAAINGLSEKKIMPSGSGTSPVQLDEEKPGKDSDWDWDWDDKWTEEWEREQEAKRVAEYQSVGVTMDGKNYYYQGQLVNIFLDQRPNRSVYTLDRNPAGTVNVKILRSDSGAVTGAAYLTEAEAAELLRDME